MSASRTNRRSLNRRIEKYVRFSLTNAQMLALNTTPITVVTAPPAGFAHVVYAMYLTCPAQATGATIGSATGLVAKYTNSSGASVTQSAPVTGFLDQTTTVQAYASEANSYLPVAAAPIVLYMTGANVTGMTGGITGRIYIKTLPISI